MNIVLTGASKGIGAALAKQFALLPGVNLFLVSRNEERLTILKQNLQSTGCNVHIIPFDLNQPLHTIKNIDHQISCKHIDVLVNNAGFLVNKSFESISAEEIETSIKTNFSAPAELIKVLLPKMGGDTPSHVVNISSMGGFQGSSKFPGLSYYSATKAAIASLTECLAAEYAGKNMFFNCLALGAVQTEMLGKAFPGYQAPLTSEEMAQYIFEFSINGYKFFNGKIIPVALTDPK
ncbi:MAG: SDR family NAD(P)-dependent oxidoreductase [Bacteroidales bacterium]|nr:SDR family NAD(P)-dependent oxidoreductase [Bacteroidales bacterium]